MGLGSPPVAGLRAPPRAPGGPLAPARTLEVHELRLRCDPDALDFETTDELEPLRDVLGQPRAAAAIEFGVGIEHEGFNVFVLGPPGTGRRTLVRRFLEERARSRPVPEDCCYVHHFEDPRKPRALRLPAGRGAELRRDMESLVEELRTAIAAAFESEEYQTRRQTLEEELSEEASGPLQEIQRRAEERGVRFIQGPGGLAFVPVRDGKPIPPDELQKLPQEERRRLEHEVENIQAELQKVFRRMPRLQRERTERVRELNRAVTRFAVDPPIEELLHKWRDVEAVGSYLEAVRSDVVEHARALVGRSEDGPQRGAGLAAAMGEEGNPFLRRYRVNVIVDHRETEGAPVVHEDNPTYPNLVGRVEHLSQMGALITDFHLIRGGALHRANGGYLIVDALDLLRQPFAWEGLKRALRGREVKIESLGEALSLVQTVSLEPEPLPLSVKVVLVGEPLLYYLLCARDPEFGELFKVAADFADRFPRDAESQREFARLVTGIVRDEGLRPFDRGAVARAIEHAARHVDDAERLSLNVRHLSDVLCEADHWAGRAGRDTARAEDVQRALDERTFRSDRLRERSLEATLRGTLDIATEGESVGQINGLSVLQLGDFAFGRPSRITARIRLGGGRVVNIEREVDLSGPLHSKGVLILSGFLGQRYALDQPLALSASLVFEQSYGGVDGDSASAAELLALLSAIADVPLSQSVAITGSVNQHGRIQAIGGVNEKVEGFFDLCRHRGLSGDQGVLIPATNAVHLMLRADVVEAVEAGRFRVTTLETIDDAIEALTGLPAGERDAEGRFPDGSFNRRVADRLAELARRRKAFAAPGATGAGAGGDRPE